MQIILRLVKLQQKELLYEMLYVYEQELIGDNNLNEYKYLDSYWEKVNRKPYFIIVNKIISGFALVNQHTLVQKDGHNIAEFYVKKELRNKEIGKKAAFKLFNLFPGKWEVRQLNSNPKARIFWNKVIKDYSNNHYEELCLNDNRWQGFIQTFTAKHTSLK
jgi:predicted acetyltransferase